LDDFLTVCGLADGTDGGDGGAAAQAKLETPKLVRRKTRANPDPHVLHVMLHEGVKRDPTNFSIFPATRDPFRLSFSRGRARRAFQMWHVRRVPVTRVSQRVDKLLRSADTMTVHASVLIQ
jgi:hypothetical protein